MCTDEEIELFVERISKIQPENLDKKWENPYDKSDAKRNLTEYLKFIKENGSGVMLVGEAPGHLGCQLTGIPFTDEVQLYNKDNFFALGNWERTSKDNLQKENSATFVWQAIREHEGQFVPLMWNAFPFHPYETEPSSNRTPNAEEIKMGKEIVNELKRMFEIKKENVYAIGKEPFRQLKLSDDKYIRHPSYGGKDECIMGIKQIVL